MSNIREHFKKIIEDPCSKIGLPHTPACFIQESKTITPITFVMLTYGGGMGGSAHKMYLKRTELETNKLITTEDIDGNKITINTRYVAYSKPLDLIEIHIESQTHGDTLDRYLAYPNVSRTVAFYNDYDISRFYNGY